MELPSTRKSLRGSNTAWPRVTLVGVVVLGALSLFAVSLSGGARGQQGDTASPQPQDVVADYRVFEFGSMEERGEYIHCVTFVSPDAENPGQLLPSDETCYKEEPEMSDLNSVGSASATGQQSGQNVIIGRHFDYLSFLGPSLTIVGRNCAGGGITLTGGRWNNRISSTRNGCSIIEHYTYSRPFVFAGFKETTSGYGANLGGTSNRVSGILYKGTLQPPPIRPTRPPPPTAPPPLPPVPPAPQPPQPVSNTNIAVSVEAIEVTQGVQNWNNEATLIRGRPTVVRAFLQAPTRSKTNALNVSADLKVSIVGTSQSETLTATNEGGQVKVYSNVADRRGELYSSLNFVLPEKWTNLTSNQRLRLKLSFGSGITTSCNEPTNANFPVNAQRISVSENCNVEVSFVDVVEPFLIIVPLEIVDNETCEDSVNTVAGTALHTVNSAQVAEQIGRIFSNMPFSQNQYFSDISDYVIRSNLRIASTCNMTNILNILQAHKTYELGKYANNSLFPVFYLGILPCDWTFPGRNVSGSSEMSQGVAAWTIYGRASGKCRDEMGYSGYARNTGSHELGHLLGLYHPASETFRGHKLGACGAKAAYNGFSYFMAIDIDGQNGIEFGKDDVVDNGDNIFDEGETLLVDYREILNGNEHFATLGPIGEDMSDQNEIWGFDVRLFQIRSLLDYDEDEDIYERNTMIISNPREVFSLMSYCRNRYASNTQVRWMDKFHHEEIIRSRSASASSSLGVGTTQTSQTLVDSELISGIIGLSSSGVPQSVSLNPIHSRTTGSRINPSGDYKLELLSSSDNVLRSISFDAGEIDVTCDNGACPNSAIPNKALFGLVINNPPAYAKLRFSKSGTTFATVTRSANAPLLSGHIISLIELSSRLPSDDVMLSWSATDSDNDNLKYTVFYSTDAGKTYSVLLMNTDATSHRLSPDSVPGSSNARVAVSVSDGLRTNFMQSETFTITNKPPRASINSLGTDSAYITGRQSSVLSASGYDLEDGNLPSAAFNWQSNIDGHLGTGRNIVISGADMTAGEHEITMTATDSAGQQVTDRIHITVSSYQILPEAIDDNASARLDDAMYFDVAANDINIDPDVARTSLTITRGLTLGTTTIAVSPGGLRSVKYTGHTSGIDTIGYRICDEVLSCSEANLYISVAIGSCTIFGTEGDDVLEGTPGDDVICGLGGNDSIDAKRGNDVIYGGLGDDTLYGRDGDDIIYGGAGKDLILGHRGDDVLRGRLGDDRIYGGGGNDIITGGKGSDSLYGEADNDTLEGNQDADLIHGGRGDDIIIGGPGNDTIRGNTGADTIYIGEGTDTLLGTAPEDNVIN